MSALGQKQTFCSAAVDRDLSGHVLSNFGQEVPRTTRAPQQTALYSITSLMRPTLVPRHCRVASFFVM